MKTRTGIIFLSLFLFLTSTQCHRLQDCFCTEIFVMQMVQLLDESNQPVSGASLTISFSDSGNIISCSQYDDASKGSYCIFNDNYVEQLDVDGEYISVIFEKSGYQIRTQTYLFNTDSCKCHINLLTGNTTIVLKQI